jgi:hypothetical protein
MAADTYDLTADPEALDDGYDDEEGTSTTLKGVEDETGRDHAELTDEEFEDAVEALVSEAVSFADDEVRPEQERGARYYRGECDLTSQKGRSKAVNRVVYEVVSGIMPDLIRIYTTVDRPVSFLAKTQDKVPLAEQQSDYVSYVLECNNWFSLLYDNVWNALTTKVGIFRTYWNTDKQVRYVDFTRLTEEEYLVLSASKSTFIGKVKVVEEGQADGSVMKYYSGTVRKESGSGRISVENIDPAEWIVDRRATGPEDALIQGIASFRTVDDLVAAGYDRGELLDMAEDSPFGADASKSKLREDRMFKTDEPVPVEGLKWVEYIDVLVRLDRDGDGIPELTRCVLLGSAHELKTTEKVDASDYSWWSPIRIPHSPIGFALADITTDLQDQGTAVLRGLLDNIYLANTPRQWAVQNQINLDDLSDFRFGATIRMRQPGMAGYLETPQVATQSLAGMEYLDKIKERRTGYSDAAMGIDPKAMQSTTLMAISSTISAARARVELIARIFGEVALTQLFKRILQLSVKHDDRKKIVRLRGNFVEVDPALWDLDLDLTVNVGLGRGTLDEKTMALGQIAQKQEQILMQLGPGNPLCSMSNYRFTLGKMVEMAGFKEVDSFFQPIQAVQQGEQAMKQAQGQQQPNPDMIKAQAAVQQVQAQTQAHMQKAQLDSQIAQQKLGLEMQRMQNELMISKARAQTDMMTTQAKAQNEMQIAQLKAGVDASLKHQELQAEIALEPLKMQLHQKAGQGNIPQQKT